MTFAFDRQLQQIIMNTVNYFKDNLTHPQNMTIQVHRPILSSQAPAELQTSEKLINDKF